MSGKAPCGAPLVWDEVAVCKDHGVRCGDADLLRAEFLRLLTVDSETKDRRKREYNQAIFNAEGGWAIWSSTDLDMVMQKFDRAAKAALR